MVFLITNNEKQSNFADVLFSLLHSPPPEIATMHKDIKYETRALEGVSGRSHRNVKPSLNVMFLLQQQINKT